MKIEGSTAVVTGASAGIGRQIAVQLASRGATVYAVARREEELSALADAVGGIKALVADITDAGDRDRIVREPGEIDILVNNAGAGWAGAFEDMTPDDVERLVQLNLVAPVELCRRIAPDMAARGRGHIVNMGSMLGFVPGPPLTLYSSIKAATDAFTQGLRREYNGRGVDVTLIAPGPVKGTEALQNSGDSEATDTLETLFELVGATAEDVADAVIGAIEHPGRPGSRDISVPRVAGLSRFAEVPGVSWGLDQAFSVMRKAGVKLK
ncbi:MAG: SDR family NAD(P)-dependent oxidoreductase [Acidimicrobiia bacterium]